MSDIDFGQLPESVRDYRPQCPGCTPQKAIAPDGKSCSFYDCPGLPAGLKVTCDMCMFDFAKEDGQIKCDHSTCETAARLRANVGTYRAWVRLIAAEMAAEAQSRKLTN